MSEQKNRRNFMKSQPKSFQHIYQSRMQANEPRFISSYPSCISLGRRIDPMIMSSRKVDANFDKCQAKYEIANTKKMQASPLKQSVRPKSLDFKNNLFQKLASKLQKKREQQYQRNQEVLNEYYDDANNKQNNNQTNYPIKKQLNMMTKKDHNSSKKNLIRQSRYQKCLAIRPSQKIQIKFIKLKSQPSINSVGEQIDIVRTSDADFKASKSSLDMCPLL